MRSRPRDIRLAFYESFSLQPLKILLLKDPRPGHFRKSEGVAKAIARHLPIEISELQVKAPRGVPSRLLRAVPLRQATAPLLLRLFWGIRAEAAGKPHLIISTGADTLVPNALLSAHTGARNIFVGTIRGMATNRFSAVLSARPELAGVPNHFIVLSPSGVDPDALSCPSSMRTLSDLKGKTLAVLIGGPTPDHAFRDADWEALERLLRQGAETGVRWLVTSSRRTPEAVADRLAACSAATPGVEFIDFRRARAGSIDPLFNADAILVTEDSNTMVSEGVAARRPVIALRPGHLRKEMASLRVLDEERRIRIVPMREATLERTVAAINETIPLDRNPMDVLYELLSGAGIVPAGG